MAVSGFLCLWSTSPQAACPGTQSILLQVSTPFRLQDPAHFSTGFTPQWWPGVRQSLTVRGSLPPGAAPFFPEFQPRSGSRTRPALLLVLRNNGGRESGNHKQPQGVCPRAQPNFLRLSTPFRLQDPARLSSGFTQQWWPGVRQPQTAAGSLPPGAACSSWSFSPVSAPGPGPPFFWFYATMVAGSPAPSDSQRELASRRSLGSPPSPKKNPPR